MPPARAGMRRPPHGRDCLIRPQPPSSSPPFGNHIVRRATRHPGTVAGTRLSPRAPGGALSCEGRSKSRGGR
eukprot:scaffold125646_cov30-Tisochrysis_lutea.AAC.3